MPETTELDRPHPTGGYTHIRVYVGATCYMLDGDLHREDGPAFVSVQGDERWHLNGFLHRVNGPAITTRNGAELWYRAGARIPKPENHTEA